MSDILNFNIIDISFVTRNTAGWSTENRSCFILSCRTEGKAKFNFKNNEITVGTGDILYIPKGTSYTQHTDGEKVFFIHLDILGRPETEVQHITPQNPDKICDFFRTIESLWQEKKENYRYRCASMLYELVADTGITVPKSQKKSYGLLYPAMQYINGHFYKPDFSLENACKLSHISRVYFNRLFRKKTGITPALYVNNLKTEKAKYLLSSGLYTNDEIANLCGFNDTKYFYTVFKRINGITVGKYRKLNNSNPSL